MSFLEFSVKKTGVWVALLLFTRKSHNIIQWVLLLVWAAKLIAQFLYFIHSRVQPDSLCPLLK